jgi:hypothetical protein
MSGSKIATAKSCLSSRVSRSKRRCLVLGALCFVLCALERHFRELATKRGELSQSIRLLIPILRNAKMEINHETPFFPLGFRKSCATQI